LCSRRLTLRSVPLTGPKMRLCPFLWTTLVNTGVWACMSHFSSNKERLKIMAANFIQDSPAQPTPGPFSAFCPTLFKGSVAGRHCSSAVFLGARIIIFSPLPRTRPCPSHCGLFGPLPTVVPFWEFARVLFLGPFNSPPCWRVWLQLPPCYNSNRALGQWDSRTLGFWKVPRNTPHAP